MDPIHTAETRRHRSLLESRPQQQGQEQEHQSHSRATERGGDLTHNSALEQRSQRESTPQHIPAVDDNGFKYDSESDFEYQEEDEEEGTQYWTYQDSAVERELKLRASTALHDHSVLLLHALSMNETPARTRLRMYRHLAGQPQPSHEYTPNKGKQKGADHPHPSTSNHINLSASSSSSSKTAAGSSSHPSAQSHFSGMGIGGSSSNSAHQLRHISRPTGSSSSSQYSLLSAQGSSTPGFSRGTLQTADTPTIRPRRDIIPLDDEFGHTHFQGALSD